MNKATRMLAVTGMALMTGLTLGAGPAAAASSSSATTASTTKSSAQTQADRRVQYFRSEGACERAGRLGRIHGRWIDWDCDHIRVGFRRGFWVLDVEYGWSDHFRPGNH